MHLTIAHVVISVRYGQDMRCSSCMTALPNGCWRFRLVEQCMISCLPWTGAVATGHGYFEVNMRTR